MTAPGYRVAFVTDAPVVGGAETALAHLAGALPSDVEVVVIGPHEPTLRTIAAARPGAATAACPMRVLALRRTLRAQDVDVVHVNLTSFIACRAAPWAALLARRPVVLVDHGPASGLTAKGRARQRVLTALAAARVGVGVGASTAAERWGGLRPGSVRPIPNGVPAPTLPDRPSRPADPVVLGVLARLSPEKGVDVLLRALVEVPDVALVVAGDGPERPALDGLAAELGLGERITFLGWASDPGAVLAGLDGVVVPSRSEGLPLVVLEAMHAGLPVVASDVGSVAEAVREGETGLLVPPDDPGALAAALRRLAADADLRARLGERGAEVAAAEFSVSAMANAYDDLYRSVARRGRRRGAHG